MANSYSNIEAQEIIAFANAALGTIDGIIRERLEYELAVHTLYDELVDRGGNKLAKSISLVRIGAGKYRTPGSGKKAGTASNLYLAATSGTEATIETRSGMYSAKACYTRALAAAGIDEHSDAFEDLVFAGYKLWLHEEIFDKPLSEWKVLRAAIAEAVKEAEPALQGGLSRLFMNAQAKQTAFEALDKLRELDVNGIVRHAEYWPEFSAKRFSSKEELCYCFKYDEEDRGNILGCLHAQLGDFELNGVVRRPFTSEDAQRALDQLEGVAGVADAISDARNAVGEAIVPAVERLRESDLVAGLAQHPIDGLGEAKAGVQIKKLQDAGVLTLGDLYGRMHSPEKGALPGIGPKTRGAVESFLEPIVADIRRGWSLRLSVGDRTDVATQLVRTVKAYIELGELGDKARQALAGTKLPDDAQTNALLYATDELDWLLAGDEQVKAAVDAMDAAQSFIESKDGTWLLSCARGTKIKRLETELVSADKAWKAFEQKPNAFYEVIKQFTPEALTPVEQEPASAETGRPEAAPAVEAKPARTKRAVAEPTSSRESSKTPRPVAQQKAGADLLEQTKAFYRQFEGLTMMFTPAEDAPVFGVASKYIVGADAPRVQGATFSLAIPDGWVSDEDTAGRAFVLVPKSHAGEGMESPVAILYGKAPVGEDYATAMQQSGIPPIQWATHYVARSLAANFTCEMHEVEARNCRCAVVRVPTADEECSEFYIYPYSLIGQDYARVTFYEPEDVSYEQARTFVDDLARTVEIDGPTTPAIMERLEGRVAEATSLEEVDKVISPILVASTLFCQEVFDAALRFYQSGVGEGNATFEGLAGAGICALDQQCDASVPLMNRVLKLLSAWIDLHPLRAEELEYCGNMLNSLVASSTIRPETFSDMKDSQSDFYQELARFCKPTPKQQALLDKIDAFRKALDLPDSVGGNDNQISPAEEAVPMEGREPEPAPAQGEGMDLPVFFLTFLSRGWFFFGDDILSDEDGIAWDGSRHSITNLKIDFPSLQEMQKFIQEADMDFENESEVADYLIAFLNELEKDNALRVSRKRIARGVQKALPKGPLTGMTLATLCESSRGLTFRGGFDTYQVFFDTRLSRGIPQFFSLIARMLWDLRACLKSLDGRPFDIMFLATRSFDADPYLGAVDEPVAGAQDCPMQMHVAERPQIDLS